MTSAADRSWRSPLVTRSPDESGKRRSAAGTLGRAEHDEDLEPLGNVVEAVRDIGGDEHERAAPDVPGLRAYGDRASPRGDVVQLVLAARRLRINRSRLEDVHPCGQVGD